MKREHALQAADSDSPFRFMVRTCERVRRKPRASALCRVVDRLELAYYVDVLLLSRATFDCTSVTHTATGTAMLSMLPLPSRAQSILSVVI